MADVFMLHRFLTRPFVLTAMHGWHLSYVLHVRPFQNDISLFIFVVSTTQARIKQFTHIKFHVFVECTMRCTFIQTNDA